LSKKVQEELLLNEVHLDTELHFTSDGESCGELWYLDNGASNHMTGDRQKFRDLNTTVGGKVSFGDGFVVEIHGRGSILF